MSGGSFMVARSVWDHPAFARSEFSEREAFLWMVSEAAWKPRSVRVGTFVATLERGQFCASVRFMAEAWGWSKSRVARFLDRLRDRDMIEKRDSSGTAPLVITLCNYDKFQGLRDTGETKAGQQRDSSGTNDNKGNKGNKDNNPPTPRKRVEDDPAFSEFWASYPRKVAKGAARKAWAKAIRIADLPTIIAAASRIEDRGEYTPHPATWLNAERWNDEPEKPHGQRPNHAPRQHRHGGLFDAALRIAERSGTAGGDPGDEGGDGPGGTRMDSRAGGGAVVALLATGRAAGNDCGAVERLDGRSERLSAMGDHGGLQTLSPGRDAPPCPGGYRHALRG